MCDSAAVELFIDEPAIAVVAAHRCEHRFLSFRRQKLSVIERLIQKQQVTGS